MTTITVAKKFILTLQDHTTRVFEAGVHQVEDDIASHWFVGAHSVSTDGAPATTTAEPDADKAAAQAQAEALAAAQKAETDAESVAAAALRAEEEAAAAAARAKADVEALAGVMNNKKPKP